MRPLVDLATKLFPFDYSVTSTGNDASFDVLKAELPFKSFSYDSGRQLNGWQIPHKCNVEKAELRLNGQLIYDGKAQPLGVPALSDGFVGRLSREELLPHLFSVPGDRAAIPYHWTRLYRPNDPVWGFCMSQDMIDSLPNGTYDVDLRTKLEPWTMKVFVYELPGTTSDTILLNAHNCHPFQANDDISGVVVGIEVMKRLAALPQRRYTYTLMVAPELFGPMFWLDGMSAEEVSRLRGTIMLKSVGNDAPLRLQQSYHGNSVLDLAAHNQFRLRYETYEHGAFRAIYGNDETVFESPPYEVPSISVTRWPFPEYHTHLDSPDRLVEARLEDTVQAVEGVCKTLELNAYPKSVAKGLVCLSRYGLYKPVPPVTETGVDYTSVAGRWNRLMNTLPRQMDGKTGVLEIAERFKLPVVEVRAYIQSWVDHGLALFV